MAGEIFFLFDLSCLSLSFLFYTLSLFCTPKGTTKNTLCVLSQHTSLKNNKKHTRKEKEKETLRFLSVFDACQRASGFHVLL